MLHGPARALAVVGISPRCEMPGRRSCVALGPASDDRSWCTWRPLPLPPPHPATAPPPAPLRPCGRTLPDIPPAAPPCARTAAAGGLASAIRRPKVQNCARISTAAVGRLKRMLGPRSAGTGRLCQAAAHASGGSGAGAIGDPNIYMPRVFYRPDRVHDTNKYRRCCGPA